MAQLQIIKWIASFLLVLLCAVLQADENLQSDHWVLPKLYEKHIQRNVFYSKLIKHDVSYYVYVPPIYERDTTKEFPVLYWLHGHKSPGKGVLPLSRYFGRAIELGKLPPCLIVFPNGLGESMWADSKGGKVPMERIFIKEIIPHVESRYRVKKNTSDRWIEGFSMGGYGAARLGFKYPNLFGRISILGAGPMQPDFDPDSGARELKSARKRIMKEVYGGDKDYFYKQSPWALAIRNADKIRGKKIRILVGENDPMKQPNIMFHQHLLKLGIPHQFHVVPGVGHRVMQLLVSIGDKNWRFYRVAEGPRALRSRSHPKYFASPLP